MAQRIIWTYRAEIVFSDILLYYYKRNGNKTYSNKLHKEIQQILNFLKKHPFLGKVTENEEIRVLIKSNFKIFYKTESDTIIILLVWDCRQNPEGLKI